MFPNLFALTLLNILPQRLSRQLALVEDQVHFIQVIDLLRNRQAALVTQGTAAHAIHFPTTKRLSICIHRCKTHSIRMKRKFLFSPDHFQCARHKNTFERRIGQMSAPCGREASIKFYAIPRRRGIPLTKNFRRTPRPHRVAARRPHTNSIKFLNRFHDYSCFYSTPQK